MDIEQRIADHYAILRKVMADPAMNPEGAQVTINQRANFSRVGEMYIATPEREALHDQWINEVIQDSEAKAGIGIDRHAVVMAGAPGMGKGTIQREQFKGLPGFVACDPDKFKEKIIDHEYRNDTLGALDTPLMAELKAQGHEFAPMEYSTLVHQESSLLSRQLQQQLQYEGKNYIVDTVLKNTDSAKDIMERLDGHNYTYDVVSVQGTAAESKAGIYGRWEDAYREYLEMGNELGGRPVPSEFADSTFPDSQGPSTTEIAAQWLAESGKGVQCFQQYRRGIEGPEIDSVKVRGRLISRSSIPRKELPALGIAKMNLGNESAQTFDADFPRSPGTTKQHIKHDSPQMPVVSSPEKNQGIER